MSAMSTSQDSFDPLADWEKTSVRKSLSSRLLATVYKNEDGYWAWKIECKSYDGEYFVYDRSGVVHTSLGGAQDDVLLWYKNQLINDSRIFDMSTDEVYKTALTAFEDLKKAPAQALAFHEKFKGYSNKLAGLVAEHGPESHEVAEYIESTIGSEFHGPLTKLANFMGYTTKYRVPKVSNTDVSESP